MFNPRARHTQMDAPPAGPRVIPLKRVGANDRLVLVVCAMKFYGMMVHWSGRSRPHTEPRQKCDGCQHQNAMKWLGWLHCCSAENLNECFIEFTSLGHESALTAMGGQVVTGSKLMIWREGGKLRAPLLVEKMSDYDGLRGELPKPRNPSATLSKLWNCLVTLDD